VDGDQAGMRPPLEIKKTGDGRLLARRTDGRPLTDEDVEAAKLLAESNVEKATDDGPIPPSCWGCGATMTRTKDIYGRPWWACWSCARTA